LIRDRDRPAFYLKLSVAYFLDKCERLLQGVVGRCVIITSWPFEFDCRDRAYRMFRGIGIRENDLFVENDDVSTLSGFRTKDF
jgi:hypothetical protein